MIDTPPSRPAIQLVTPTNRTQSSASVSWSHSSSSISAPTHFDISIYPLYDLSGTVDIRRFIVDKNGRSFSLTGLDSNSSYRLSLMAANDAGSSPAASTILPRKSRQGQS